MRKHQISFNTLTKFLSFINPKVRSIFQVVAFRNLTIMACLRLGLSHFNVYNSNYNYQDCVILLWRGSLEVEISYTSSFINNNLLPSLSVYWENSKSTSKLNFLLIGKAFDRQQKKIPSFYLPQLPMLSRQQGFSFYLMT